MHLLADFTKGYYKNSSNIQQLTATGEQQLFAALDISILAQTKKETCISFEKLVILMNYSC